MFGLLRPHKRCLATEDWADYASAYCNLCATLSYRYGVQNRLLVVHDVAAADWLLSGASPAPRAFPVNNCLQGGVRSVPPERRGNERGQFLAAVSAYIIGIKVQDDLADGGSWKARLAFAFYKETFSRARGDLLAGGFDVAELESALAQQTEVEQRGETDLERAARPSGTAFGLIARHLGARHGSGINGDAAFGLGERIGRAVFLVDAHQDFARDVRTGNYNPLHNGVTEATGLVPERRAELRQTVNSLLEEAQGLCADMGGRVAERWCGARATLAASVGEPDKDRPARRDKPEEEAEGAEEGKKKPLGKRRTGPDATDTCCAGWACCEVSCCCLDVAACL